MIDDDKIIKAASELCDYGSIHDSEYRIVKIEKGLFLIEYKTAPYGVWHEVKDKQFKIKPKADAWARKNLV